MYFKTTCILKPYGLIIIAFLSPLKNLAMSILKYLKPRVEKKAEKTEDGFPDPSGSLSSFVPSSAIESANAQIRQATQAKAIKKTTRGSYHKLSPEMRAKIGQYSCENGASRYFSRPAQLGRLLNESTIRGIKQSYIAELNRKRKAREEPTITELVAWQASYAW